MAQLGEMKREGGGGHVELLAETAGREARRSHLHQGAEDCQAMFLGERFEGGDDGC